MPDEGGLKGGGLPGAGELGGGDEETQTMAAKYVHEGISIDYTPTADVAAGHVVVQGELVGVARLDIRANTLGALAVAGVFDFPKVTGGGSAIAVGAKCYWDDTNDVATTNDGAGANKYVGKAVKAAGDSDASVRVRMSQ